MFLGNTVFVDLKWNRSKIHLINGRWLIAFHRGMKLISGSFQFKCSKVQQILLSIHYTLSSFNTFRVNVNQNN